jgi:hypothetical protein
MQRFFLALHATAPAALILSLLVHLRPPPGLAPLAQRPVWTVWVLIGAWLLLATLAARALRTLALWRVSLGGAGALLMVAGAVGQVRCSAQAPAMLVSLATVGLVCVGLAAFIGPRRVQAPRRKNVRPAAVAGGAAAHRGRRLRFVPGHLPFWWCGALALESFRLAHIVATEPAHSSGMLGLLLAFWVALPAATLRHWAPRTATLLWVLAALGYGGLATKAGLPQWVVASALCAVMACTTACRPPTTA